MTTIGTKSYYDPSLRQASADKSKSKSDSVYSQSNDRMGTPQIGSGSSSETAGSGPSTVTVDFQGKLINLELKRFSDSGLKATPAWESNHYDSVLGMREMLLERKYTQFPDAPDLSNYGGIKPYATVEVGGRIVATIDNQGGVSSDDGLGRKLRDMLIGEVNGKNGPDLAKARAEQIAELVGGRVEKSETALSQREFDALPPPENPQPWIDYDAMKADSEYTQIQDLKLKREEFLRGK